MKKISNSRQTGIKEILDRSFSILARTIGKEDVQKPAIVVGQTETSYYDPNNQTIFIAQPTSGRDYRRIPCIVGEEITHYLHHAVRPDVMERTTELLEQVKEAGRRGDVSSAKSPFQEYMITRNYEEAVGHAGGLLVATVGFGLFPTDETGTYALNPSSVIQDLAKTGGDTDDHGQGVHSVGYLTAYGMLYHGRLREFPMLFNLDPCMFPRYAWSFGVEVPNFIPKVLPSIGTIRCDKVI